MRNLEWCYFLWGPQRQENKRQVAADKLWMYLCTIRFGDREGSQTNQPRKESGKRKFHKKKNSKRPQCQQENVVLMSLTVFFPSARRV